LIGLVHVALWLKRKWYSHDNNRIAEVTQ
jgi:hypothetical protein